MQLGSPEVLVPGRDGKCLSQIDRGVVGEDAVNRRAAAESVAAAAAHGPGAGRLDHETRRALTVGGLSHEGVALQAHEVRQQEAGRTSIAPCVTGMALDDGVRQRRIGRIEGVVVITAAGIVECAGDRGIAPGLVDAQTHDRIEEGVSGVVIGSSTSQGGVAEGKLRDIRDGTTAPPVLLPESSIEKLSEMPPPNWAV